VTLSGPGRPASGVRRPLVRDPTRQPRAFQAHLGGDVLEPVVGLADTGRGERVRRGDVRAGVEVRVVDLGHGVGPCEVEEIRIALDVPWMSSEALAAILLLRIAAPVDEHAPRPVEDEDPLRQ
jgi:hypothetical protein